MPRKPTGHALTNADRSRRMRDKRNTELSRLRAALRRVLEATTLAEAHTAARTVYLATSALTTHPATS